jgi:CDP-glucose 4,6-dehydratase
VVAVDPRFWRGRRVLLTGHTGFKGAWLALWLERLGAHVTGLAEQPPTAPSLFEVARVGERLDDRRADVRNLDAVRAIVADARPEVVIHMAAQSLVRASFADPVGTYATNVMGTVNVLEAVRAAGDGVRAVVNVTSDKCYDNREQGRAFVEDDCMGGHDPYSNSKGCAELVADAYRRSFSLPIASARAGNVIGGGDWAADRLIPDILRGALDGVPIRIRNPESVRPWQHVLNPLSGYLLLAERLHAGEAVAEGWNFGPSGDDVQTVRWIADRVSERWPHPIAWTVVPGPHPQEATYLALDSTKARTRLGWEPRWALDETVARIVEWYVALRNGEEMRAMTLRQLDAFTTV